MQGLCIFIAKNYTCGQKLGPRRVNWSCKTHGAWKCSRGFNAPNPSPSTRTLVAEMMTISALILTAATALA